VIFWASVRAQVTPITDSSAEAPASRPKKYGSGVGTCLEYKKSSIVIVDDYLPADGHSQSINIFCQSTMQNCVAECDHRNPD
jgi:hypothetical protein